LVGFYTLQDNLSREEIKSDKKIIHICMDGYPPGLEVHHGTAFRSRCLNLHGSSIVLDNIYCARRGGGGYSFGLSLSSSLMARLPFCDFLE
jgi:hypothetical protein